MSLTRLNTLICSALCAAALGAAPVATLAQAPSAASTARAPVKCKDGTTSPYGGRGACSGHGGIDKSASAPAVAPTAAAALTRTTRAESA